MADRRKGNAGMIDATLGLTGLIKCLRCGSWLGDSDISKRRHETKDCKQRANGRVIR
jgi:hypothetical protein